MSKEDVLLIVAGVALVAYLATGFKFFLVITFVCSFVTLKD